MGAWALIVHAGNGRAEQFAHLAERARLRATVARTREEAVFHVHRLGAPTLVMADVALPGDVEIALLRDIAEVARPAAVPVVAVVDSRSTYERVARQMIDLNVAALLTRSHNLRALERAVRAAVSRAGADDPPGHAHVLPPPPPPDALGDHPLLAELAGKAVSVGTASDADLERVAADTRVAFGCALALVWLDRAERTGFAASPRLPATPLLRDGGGEWLELRTAMAGAPLHVADMAQHRVLRDNRLVLNGTVRSCAVAPVRSAEGRLVGAVGIADPRAGGIEATLLDPLVFWAERIGAGLRELERERGAGGAPKAPVSFNGGDGDAAPRTAGKSAVGEAARGLLGALDTAVMVTSGGTVAYANGRMAELLCLRNGDLRGLRRSEVLGMIASATDAAHPTLQRIANTARDPAPATVLLSFAKPLRRVLRWNTRRIRVGAQQALLEELTDVTREAEEAEAREKLVRVDAETGLPNRRAAQEALGRAMSWSLRIGMPLSVGLFAIDALSGFDPPVAAELLRSSAWILRDLLRGYDLATRYDETRLLAILPGLGAGHTARLAERYRRAVARTEVDGLPRVTVSGGMASFDGTQDADQLVEMAAAALVTAQRRGGNAVV